MTNEEHPIVRRNVLSAIGIGVVGGLTLQGTVSLEDDQEAVQRAVGVEDEHATDGDETNVLQIVGDHDHDANEHSLELSEQDIQPGLTTLEFDNQTDETHFVYVVRIPDAEAKLAAYDGATLREQYMNAVSRPFQEAWDPYYCGSIDVEEFFGALVDGLPGWFFEEIVPSGGVGLTAGGTTSKTTQNLGAGTYILECYVIGADGVFHSTTGMVESLQVTGEPADSVEPESDLSVSVSTNGIAFDDDVVESGRHTATVTFEDNQAYSHGLGHDVHLIRLEDDTSICDATDWMNYLDAGADGYYADRGALTSTADDPGPMTFLGGVQDVFPGEGSTETAYVEATYEPGEYAWVAEVPDPVGTGLVAEFTVEE